MSNTSDVQEEYRAMFEEMNEAVAESMERNARAGAAFVETWADAVDGSVPDDEALSEGIDGYGRAYEVWIDAAEELFEQTTAAAEGEDVDPAEIRDVWLDAANDAFKEVMSTAAFADANGRFVEAMMDARQEFDEVTQETIAEIGLPTRSDVEEVGERLVELERRQHAVETKLDRLLTAVENEGGDGDGD
ncbi:MAG: poly(R)-hydroxyalkanoic acid synthase subunit PhaE [Salinirussus sp.]